MFYGQDLVKTGKSLYLLEYWKFENKIPEQRDKTLNEEIKLEQLYLKRISVGYSGDACSFPTGKSADR